MKRQLLTVISLCSLLSLSCGGGGNALDGSIKTLLDIDFETVEIKFFPNVGIRVRYIKGFENTTADSVIAEMNFETNNTALVAGEEIDAKANSTLNRFVLIRDDNDNIVVDTDAFPAVFEGTVYFYELSDQPGDTVKGRGNYKFANGLVLSYEFSGEVELGDLSEIGSPNL